VRRRTLARLAILLPIAAGLSLGTLPTALFMATLTATLAAMATMTTMSVATLSLPATLARR